MTWVIAYVMSYYIWHMSYYTQHELLHMTWVITHDMRHYIWHELLHIPWVITYDMSYYIWYMSYYIWHELLLHMTRSTGWPLKSLAHHSSLEHFCSSCPKPERFVAFRTGCWLSSGSLRHCRYSINSIAPSAGIKEGGTPVTIQVGHNDIGHNYIGHIS